MQLGFETIGNATLIAFDGRPVLATDPWIAGAPYFGSWGLSHAIPPEQMAAIKSSEYIWFSHGHPDHLNGESLELLRDRRILLPAHVGGRIRKDLEARGYQVRELPVAEWVRLSERIRVMCLPDYNQDAVLLVEMGDALLVNANDASGLGWMPLITRLIRKYKRSFMLRLTGFNDADMMNFFDEAGIRIPSSGLQRIRAGVPLGPAVARLAESFGVTYFVPFSSMHRYQREDSVWANECTTAAEAHAVGFDSKRCAILPAFVPIRPAGGQRDADRSAPRACDGPCLRGTSATTGARISMAKDWKVPPATSGRSSTWRHFWITSTCGLAGGTMSSRFLGATSGAASPSKHRGSRW